MDSLTLADVVAVVEELYPPDLAEEWDRVGLVAGDPDQPVRSILFALDPTLEVIRYAVSAGFDLLVTHHPLLLRGVSSVATTHPKGSAVTELVVGDVALYCAHTNADHARNGVSDALAAACGLTQVVPVVPHRADPALGKGRVGDLVDGICLREFTRRLAQAVPGSPVGLRVAGDPDLLVRRVAVLGGAGDDMFAQVRATDADVYVTADLRHHPASEAMEEAVLRGGRPALVDAGHWASESLWLPYAAQALRAALVDRHGPLATTLDIEVSELCTDPWTYVVSTATAASTVTKDGGMP